MSDAAPTSFPSVVVRIACRDGVDNEPERRSFEVPYEKWMTVNDVLDYVTEELEEDIAYRRYCGVKKCGMCAVRVNGREVLACWEPVADREIDIEPLGNLPLLRDLVVDREAYEASIQALDPLLQRGSDPVEFPEQIRHKEMTNAAAFDCLSCLACVSATPQADDNTRGLMPALLVQVAQQALDPRDSVASGRLERLGVDVLDRSFEEGTAVCPAGIDIDRDVVEPLRRLRAKASTEMPGNSDA